MTPPSEGPPLSVVCSLPVPAVCERDGERNARVVLRPLNDRVDLMLDVIARLLVDDAATVSTVVALAPPHLAFNVGCPDRHEADARDVLAGLPGRG